MIKWLEQMNKYRIRSLLFFLLVISVSKIYAQDNNTFDLNYDRILFPALIDQIESNSSYHFYYDITQIDTLRVSVKAERASLKTVLQDALKNTGFSYAIDSNRIFITKNREIRTQLPADFFSLMQQSSNHYDVAMYDFMNDDADKTKKSKEDVIIEVGEKTKNITGNKVNVSGYIRDEKTGEPVIGAVVYQEKASVGVVTNAFGYFIISLPTGKNEVKVSCIGMKELTLQVMLYSEGSLDIELAPYVIPLKEVVIEAERGANVYRMQMGHEKLDLKTIKQVPMAMGEVDVIKAVLALPGVKSVGESSTGLNVRGGATSQNLILLDDATIYNPSHLFGFFSSFNADVIKNIELYKSSMPAKYGGRISSILEVESKEGNKKDITGSGGIGLITTRFNIEGPIVKDKISFLFGLRTTYSDWILRKIPDQAIKNSRGSFNDFHARISYEINKKNSLYITGYQSSDYFQLSSDTVYQYSNKAYSLKWKHAFTPRLNGVFSAAYSNYNYNITGDKNTINAFKHTYKINQLNAKADFSFYFNPKHSLSFGAASIYYKLNPGTQVSLNPESLITPDIIPSEQAVENALYFEDQFAITSKLTLNVGLRLSFYNFLGPNEVLLYEPGIAKDSTTVIGTLGKDRGGIIKTYGGPEYRLSARYMINGNTSVKISYQKVRQYIHMLSNTTAISPSDIWKLSDPNILPEIGDQIALGLYRNFNSNAIEISVEGYYKKMKNFLDYKNGAILLLNHNIERDILNTLGSAYGIELLIKRPKGKLNGWLSYTYSRSLLKTDTKTTGEIINGGIEYPSNYDKPHDVTFVGNYRFTRRFSISANMTYSTGRPITLPLAKYNMYGGDKIFYSERNQSRVPDYFRTDISLNLEGNHRIKKLAHYSWSFSVYNLTGRKNAYSVFYKSENGKINGYKLSIFGQPIPTLTYNFRF